MAYTKGQSVLAAASATNTFTGTVSLYFGTNMQLIVTSKTGNFSASSWGINLAGAVGQQGEPGIAGTTGNTGSQGTTGTTGNTGNSGLQGTTGTTGTTGNTGNTGLQGTTGTTGNTGNTGLQGTTGTTGTTGNTGNTGLQGTTGTTGNTGNTGLQGTTGTTGTTGNTGNTGLQGTTGTTGTTGNTGNTGLQGTTGTTGTTGNTGNTGLQGTTGTTGTTGNTGAGVPTGGLDGQFLRKYGSADYGTTWATITAGAGSTYIGDLGPKGVTADIIAMKNGGWTLTKPNAISTPLPIIAASMAVIGGFTSWTYAGDLMNNLKGISLGDGTFLVSNTVYTYASGIGRMVLADTNSPYSVVSETILIQGKSLRYPDIALQNSNGQGQAVTYYYSGGFGQEYYAGWADADDVYSGWALKLSGVTSGGFSGGGGVQPF